MKTTLRIVALFCITQGLFGQKFEFGAVSMEELQQIIHPLDSSAPAAILYKRGHIEMQYNNQWSYNLKVEARIKVYNKEGYAYSTVEVPLYMGDGGNKEKITGLKAFTYNLENGKIVKEKISKEGEFEEAVSENWAKKKFVFANVKEGSVLEYSYEINSPYITTLPEWQFQYDIPVNAMEYTTRIPEYFNYRDFQKGYFPIKRETTSKMGKFTFRYQYNEPGTSTIDAHKSQLQTLDCNVFINTYKANDISKLVDEKYVNNINNYRTSIKQELASSKMPQSYINYYSQTWESVAKKVYEYDSFGKELDRTGYFEADLMPLLAAATVPEEKAGIVFNFVKQKVSWNGNFGFGCPKGVKDAYKTGTGNVAEINLMLTALLRHAGLNANPVLVSTRSHGIPLFPTTDGFNYVISAIELDNGMLLLDATSKFSSPNILPERALNWFGRLIRKDGTSSNIDLTPSILSKETVNLNVNLTQDGSLTGKYRKQYTDHSALVFRQYYSSMDGQKYQEQLENSFGDIQIETLEVGNISDLGKPIVEVFGFTKDNAVDLIGDKMYFSPMFFLADTENPFKLDAREYPVDFSFPKVGKALISIKVPDGYKVEVLPAPNVIVLPDNLGTFKYLISTVANTIQLSVNSDINTAIITSNYYGSLKEFYRQLVEKQTEKIVLTKI